MTEVTRKLRGSVLFDKSVMTTEECLEMANTLIENGNNAAEIDAKLRFFDDLLIVNRNSSFIAFAQKTPTGRRKVNGSLREIISNRLEVLAVELNPHSKASVSIRKTNPIIKNWDISTK